MPRVRGVWGVTVVGSVEESDDGGGSVVVMSLLVTVGTEVGETWAMSSCVVGMVLVGSSVNESSEGTNTVKVEERVVGELET